MTGTPARRSLDFILGAGIARALTVPLPPRSEPSVRAGSPSGVTAPTACCAEAFGTDPAAARAAADRTTVFYWQLQRDAG
jgi:hypothetical protein